MTALPLIFEGLFILSLISLYLVFKFGYKKSILERQRSNLFEYRSRLYHLLKQEKIKANHPSYRHVEKHVNSLLQYSHRTNTIRILFSMFVMKMGWYKAKHHKKYWDGVNSMPQAQELDDEVIQELLHIKRESFNTTIKFLPKYSPGWLMVKPLLYAYLILKKAYKISKNIDAQVISREYDLVDYNQNKSYLILNKLGI